MRGCARYYVTIKQLGLRILKQGRSITRKDTANSKAHIGWERIQHKSTI